MYIAQRHFEPIVHLVQVTTARIAWSQDVFHLESVQWWYSGQFFAVCLLTVLSCRYFYRYAQRFALCFYQLQKERSNPNWPNEGVSKCGERVFSLISRSSPFDPTSGPRRCKLPSEQWVAIQLWQVMQYSALDESRRKKNSNATPTSQKVNAPNYSPERPYSH